MRTLMMRYRRAIATACVRFRAPSFRPAAWTCSSTVRLAIWRISPISLADLPCATHARTSRSRGVSDAFLAFARPKVMHLVNESSALADIELSVEMSLGRCKVPFVPQYRWQQIFSPGLGNGLHVSRNGFAARFGFVGASYRHLRSLTNLMRGGRQAIE